MRQPLAFTALFLRHRTWLIALAMLAVSGVSWAVLYQTLGIRQNQAEAEFQKAWLLYQDRKFDAAIEKFSEALLINPQFHWARRFLAQAYYLSGQTAEALEEFETLARALPHDLTLRARIEWLSLPAEGAAGESSEFLRVVPRTQGYRYSRPTFVASLHSDQLAVLSLGNFEIGSMVSYSAQGEPVENRHRVSGRLNYPMAFAQNDQEIWITDFREDKIHRLQKQAMRYLAYLFNPTAVGTPGEAQLQFRAPAGICHREGEFIVADSGNNRLQRIGDDGRFIAFIQRPAQGDPMQSPFGIWCDEDSIWLTESGAARVTHLDRYGNVVAEHSPAGLSKPRHISWDPELQQFLIADEAQGVLRLNKAGEVLGRISGYTNPDGRFIAFARPYAAAYDAFRNLYVADYGSSEVVQFAPPSEKFGQLYLQVEKISAAKFPLLGVYVTVSTGPAGAQSDTGIPRYLTELKATDFRIFENDAGVGNLSADYLQRFDEVLNCVILVSRSERMREYEGQQQWVLDHLLKQIREKDRLRVLSHGSDVRAESEFINSRLKILQVVRAASAAGTSTGNPLATMSAGLYDAVSELIAREGKRAIIYLTDGQADDDSLSPYSKDRLVDYARASHVPIYVISFEHPENMASPEARESLVALAKKTGGMYYRALEIDPRIDSLLRQQKEVRYLLSYQSQTRKQRNGQYVDLRVAARFRNRKGLDLSGYFVP